VSEKAVAAFLSGIGTAMPAAWLIGHTYGPKTMIGVSAMALTLIFASFVIDKRR